MSITEKPCFLVTCDECGHDFADDYIPHFDTRKDARDCVEDQDGTVGDDGAVLCCECQPLDPDEDDSEATP